MCKWIPITRDEEGVLNCRLPENGTGILITKKTEYCDPYTSYDYYVKKDGSPGMDGFTDERSVIAWAPFPEPYRECAEEAEEEVDWYAWHDLRENPNDVPKDDSKFLLCYIGINGEDMYMTWWAKGNDVFPLYIKPIAWCYINRFEVGQK